jgi:hypothetical protein
MATELHVELIWRCPGCGATNVDYPDITIMPMCGTCGREMNLAEVASADQIERMYAASRCLDQSSPPPIADQLELQARQALEAAITRSQVVTGYTVFWAGPDRWMGYLISHGEELTEIRGEYCTTRPWDYQPTPLAVIASLGRAITKALEIEAKFEVAP